jgi:hypothetical protein
VCTVQSGGCAVRWVCNQVGVQSGGCAVRWVCNQVGVQLGRTGAGHRTKFTYSSGGCAVRWVCSQVGVQSGGCVARPHWSRSPHKIHVPVCLPSARGVACVLIFVYNQQHVTRYRRLSNACKDIGQNRAIVNGSRADTSNDWSADEGRSRNDQPGCQTQFLRPTIAFMP